VLVTRFVSLVHVAVAMTGVSFALYGTMMGLFMRAIGSRRERPPRPEGPAPTVTVFKPLAGCDDDLEENLESFARLDYPSFEILLGIADSRDPAFAVARRFAARHPNVAIRIVVTDRHAALNPKVAQLIGLEREAKGDVYVISDSNVRVTPTYLWSLVSELADPRVGIVTSLFFGAGERTLGAALENLQLCVSTAPGIAAFNAVTRRAFTVGKSMAARRVDVKALGGFAPVGGVLAEDHVLGRRFMDAGFLARTSSDWVENRNVDCTLVRTIERHTRWAQTRRSLLPAAFAIEPMITPIIVATVAALVAPSWATLVLLAVAWVAQASMAFAAVRRIRGPGTRWWWAPLEIVRAYFTGMCWARAYVSRRIAWRGHPFIIGKGSLIVPVTPEADEGARRTRHAAI
jgi:ceramide glucosyltransferase